jgi:curved DNA-binding protein CbpA
VGRIHSHYENLKVSRNAPEEVIRAAYKALAQKYHPDLNTSPDAGRVMRLLNEAWETLGDPIKRAAHDEWIVTEERRLTGDSSSPHAVHKGKATTPPDLTRDFATSKGWSWPESGMGTNGRRQAAQSSHPKATNSYRKTSVHGPVHASEGWKANSLRNSFAAIKPGILIFLISSLVLVTVWFLRSSNSPISNRNWWESYRPVDKEEEWEKKSVLAEATAGSGNIDQSSVAAMNDRKTVESSQSASPSTVSPIGLIKDGSQRTRDKTDASSTRSAEPTLKFTPIDPDFRERSGYLDRVRGAVGGLSTFKVDNSKGHQDVVVRLYENGELPAIRNFFVKKGDSFTVRDIAPGIYVMRYRYISSGSTFESDKKFTLSELRDDDGIRYSNITVTLFGVRDGNLGSFPVPNSLF